MGLAHILDAILPGPSIYDDKIEVTDDKGNTYEVDKDDLKSK